MNRKSQPGKKSVSTAQINQAPQVTAVPPSYSALFSEIKERVRRAQLRAHLAASRELVSLYWQIGRDIVLRQKHEGWGKAVIERLATDIKKEFPGIEGFSPLNLWRMRAFYLAYTQEDEFLSQPVTELGPNPNSPASISNLSPVVTDLNSPPASTRKPMIAQAVQELPPPEVLAVPWSHNLILLQKLKDPIHRLWYARQAAHHGWSRNILALQIDSALHERQGKAVTNFAHTLPPPQSDLAQQITKDPYLFDFLNLRDDANEHAVELGLLGHVEKFLLELGAGFALVGRQVHLEIGDQDFYLDLLFFHLQLRCFIVVDLKARDFTPEAAGKMNFYLSAVDDRFRQPGDQPSIGLLLCAQKPCHRRIRPARHPETCRCLRLCHPACRNPASSHQGRRPKRRGAGARSQRFSRIARASRNSLRNSFRPRRIRLPIAGESRR